MNKLLTFTIITLYFSVQANCQIPENFEFLNHSHINIEVDEIAILDSFIIGASNAGVDIIGADHSLTSDITPITTADNYKLITRGDSIVYYLSWDLFEIDVNFVGPRVISIVSEGFDRDFFDVTFSNNNEKGYDMTYDTTGGWWFLSNLNLYFINPNGEIEEKASPLVNSQSLYTACNGDIYIVDGFYLYHFDGTDYVPNFEIFVQDLLCKNNKNYVLDYGDLYRYDADFNQLLKSWELPAGVQSMDQIHFKEQDELLVWELDDNVLTVHAVDADSNAEIIYSKEIGTNQETIKGVNILSDSVYLTFGAHAFNLHEQSFYRNIHKDKDLDYPKSDLELINFDLNYQSTGLIDDIFLDSLVVLLEFTTDLKLGKLAENEIRNCHIFSTEFYIPGAFFFDVQPLRISNIYSQTNNELNLNSFPIRTISDYLDTMRFEITGADYKFLKNGSILVNPNLISSITENQTEELSIFPNPTDESIQIRNGNIKEIELFDLQGKLLMNKSSNESISSLKLSQIPSGAYFIKASDHNGNIYFQKLIKK